MLDTTNLSIRNRMTKLALYGAVLGELATPEHVTYSPEWQAFMDGVRLRIPETNWSLSAVRDLNSGLRLILTIDCRLLSSGSRMAWWA